MDPAKHAEAYAEAAKDLAEAEKRVLELQAVARYHKEKAGNEVMPPPATTQVKTSQSEEPHGAAIRTSRRFAKTKQVDAAAIVLREAGRPLRAAEIGDLMIEGGFPVVDKRKLRNSLFTSMTRKPDVFKKIGVGAWDLIARNGAEQRI